ncbi:hypothetical protein DP939_06645 [Spongiactinospora rosea]|uniref:H-type lectin domain-containing protein n=1 Tax=Spongiactinospora rosea TaxID=2248750 RepID=A0A366M5P3_9ACTN|nr:hypothetical protein [Spongiactinospora rosea]RBQ20752.1 hypothetical protein DP939_06645 [Spongiactinospora rosea]
MSMIQTGVVELGSDDPVETASGNTSTFTRVTFPTPFPSGSQVIVLPFAQTFNGSDPPGIRLADVNEQGFLIRLNEVLVTGSVKSNGVHAVETIGWLASTI